MGCTGSSSATRTPEPEPTTTTTPPNSPPLVPASSPRRLPSSPPPLRSPSSIFSRFDSSALASRRRSSAISGPRPTEIPLTDSDQQLANLVGRINTSGSAHSRATAPSPSPPRLARLVQLPTFAAFQTLAVPAEDLGSGSSGVKTPTQADFPSINPPRSPTPELRTTSQTPVHNRLGPIGRTSLRLPPIDDEEEDGDKTPTNRSPQLPAVPSREVAESIPNEELFDSARESSQRPPSDCEPFPTTTGNFSGSESDPSEYY